MGDLGSIPGLGRSSGGGHGNPFQYSCLENPQGQRRLVGYSPRSLKEWDTTKWLSTQAQGPSGVTKHSWNRAWSPRWGRGDACESASWVLDGCAYCSYHHLQSSEKEIESFRGRGGRSLKIGACSCPWDANQLRSGWKRQLLPERKVRELDELALATLGYLVLPIKSPGLKNGTNSLPRPCPRVFYVSELCPSAAELPLFPSLWKTSGEKWPPHPHPV